MAEIRDDREALDAVVVSHHWTERGREAKLALEVVYDVPGQGEVSGLIWFTEAAQSMGRRALRSLGFDITAKDPGELDDKHTLLAGAKCKVKLSPYSYNGQTVMQADLVIPRDVPVGRGSLKALGERIKAPPAAKPKAAAQDESWMTEPINEAPPARAKPTETPPARKPDGSINFDDCPFSILTTLCLVGVSLFA